MSRKKSRTDKALTGFGNALPSMERWLLCQDIGKVFYDREISYEKLLQLKEFFITSDFLKGTEFSHKSTP